MICVIKRGGNVGREVAFNKQLMQERWWCNERAREAQCEVRDGGVTREGRGGMARFCTGSTTKGNAARQQVI